jgi:PAB-dependent poly(A)-specific ribonuclease subunit 2
LKKDIQTTSHDSIEDAKYALLLWKAYKGFVEEGRFEEVIEDVFYEGQKMVSVLFRDYGVFALVGLLGR